MEKEMNHKDTLGLIALELNNKDLFSLCRSSSLSNRLICKNDNFWLSKLIKERPQLLSIFKEYSIEKYSYKYIYMQSLQNKVFYFKKSDKEIIFIKGDFTNMLPNFKDSQIKYFSEKKQNNNWLLSYYKNSLMDAVLNPNIKPDLYAFNTYNEAFSTVIRDIKQNITDEYMLSYYADVLRAKNVVEVDEMAFNNYYQIKTINIL